MVGKVLLFLGTILIVVNSGVALYCYSCLTSTTSDCFDADEHSYIIEECLTATTGNFSVIPSLSHMMDLHQDNNQPVVKAVCLQVTLADLHPKAFLRACSYVSGDENTDVCEILESVLNIEGCYSCENYFCNSLPGTLRP